MVGTEQCKDIVKLSITGGMMEDESYEDESLPPIGPDYEDED
jgi:hypothetical protein